LLPKKSQKMELQIFSTAFKDGGGSEIEFWFLTQLFQETTHKATLFYSKADYLLKDECKPTKPVV
jgi:hypothetical protein